ncbi:MAG TPA: hypothetical protein VGB94_12490 [Acidobacteriaceae bacterium]
MKRMLIGLLVLGAFVQCFGQLHNMAGNGDIDSNAILRSAEKVAVFIELGPPATAPYVPDFARAKKQISDKLAKAKLNTVVNPADADIVIVVHEINEGSVGNSFKDTSCLGDKVDVFKGGHVPADSDAPIFSVNEYCGISWPLNRAMDKLLKAMKR